MTEENLDRAPAKAPLSHEERASREHTIATEYDGILPYFEAFYLASIAYAAGRAVAAFDRFELAVKRADNEETVASVQEALTHVAALSRFFWPVRKSALAQARGRRLRAGFGVEDGSPLQSRELRNALEHFDERLDAFLVDDHFGYFFPGAMVGDVSLSEDVMGHIFRLVDPKSLQFVLLGEVYSFGAVREIAIEIERVASVASQAGGRL
jgi:hypothetical protein